MCSIMGYAGKDLKLEELLVGFEKTKSRGPDMSRTLETPSGYLFFHRLAIMGLEEAGMQPFTLGRDAVVCNGELYGFRPLKKALEEKGYVFASAEVEMVPQNYVKLESEDDVKNMEKLIDFLEENDDVQNVYHNWEQD